MFDAALFRRHFPIADRYAFLDHAAVAPLPDFAAIAISHYATSLSQHGIAAIGEWVERLRVVRQLAARLIHADPDDICFVPNTSYGINLIAEGFPWQPGDRVVIAEDEFPSNQYPWLNLASRGVAVVRVASRGPRILVNDVRAAIDDRTRVVALSAVEYASGFRNDLAAIGELCRRRGVFFFVDAIQMLGMMPLTVDTLPIDALSADSHKWLLGPEGAGFAWIRREWIERLRPIMVGWNSVRHALDFGTIQLNLKPHAGRYESGAANVPGLTAMGASLELLLEAGVGNLWTQIHMLTDYLCDRAATIGLEVFSAREPHAASGIVSFITPGHDPAALQARCRAAGVIVNTRHNRLRVSPHAWNTIADIDRFIDALR
jgi:cysteine desulfurase / selenocysteine lyase